MREIKFRAYDKETEEWYYSDKQYEDHFFEFADGILKCFGVSENPGTLHEPPYPESYECEDVEEYTDKKDSKQTKEYPEGQEIFQGDIVKAWIYLDEKPQILEVKYSEKAAAFVIEYQDSESDITTIGWFPGNIEVIGNKYENPELIET